jgi:hypothetical protein
MESECSRQCLPKARPTRPGRRSLAWSSDIKLRYQGQRYCSCSSIHINTLSRGRIESLWHSPPISQYRTDTKVIQEEHDSYLGSATGTGSTMQMTRALWAQRQPLIKFLGKRHTPKRMCNSSPGSTQVTLTLIALRNRPYTSRSPSLPNPRTPRVLRLIFRLLSESRTITWSSRRRTTTLTIDIVQPARRAFWIRSGANSESIWRYRRTYSARARKRTAEAG